MAVGLTLGGGLLGLAKFRQLQRIDLQHKAELTRTTGAVAYRCSDRWVSIDYDPKTVGPVVLNLIAQHQGQHRRMAWSVQRPGSQPIPASTFDVNTHSIGGSRGLKWRETDGHWMAAALSFSDILGAYGPATIWVRLSDLGKADPGQNVGVVPGPDTLICGPDPASYRAP